TRRSCGEAIGQGCRRGRRPARTQRTGHHHPDLPPRRRRDGRRDGSRSRGVLRAAVVAEGEPPDPQPRPGAGRPRGNPGHFDRQQRTEFGGGVVLTFDDGTTDWVEHVLPALERHAVPATFYISTDFVERQIPFPGDGTPLTWKGIEELSSSPFVTIGSHTHRH